jgi:hypothetical protein
MNDSTTNAGARHTIISSAYGMDTLGNFPTLPAGMGNYTARIGGKLDSYRGEILEQTFTVDPGNPYLYISYALVLNIGNHLATENTYFRYDLLDNGGSPIAARYIGDADSTLTIQTSYLEIKSLAWVTDSVSLTPYIGTNITLRFTVAGCTQAGHWGYAYVNADYTYLNSITENSALQFSLYPNPGSGILNVVTAQAQSNDATLIVTDMLGQEMNVNATQNTTGWKIDMNGTKPGMYFVELRSGENRSVQRLIVE